MIVWNWQSYCWMLKTTYYSYKIHHVPCCLKMSLSTSVFRPLSLLRLKLAIHSNISSSQPWSVYKIYLLNLGLSQQIMSLLIIIWGWNWMDQKLMLLKRLTFVHMSHGIYLVCSFFDFIHIFLLFDIFHDWMVINIHVQYCLISIIYSFIFVHEVCILSGTNFYICITFLCYRMNWIMLCYRMKCRKIKT